MTPTMKEVIFSTDSNTPNCDKNCDRKSHSNKAILIYQLDLTGGKFILDCFSGGGGGTGESGNNKQSTSTNSSCTETTSMATSTACDTACAGATDTTCDTICETVTIGECTPTTMAGLQLDELMDGSWDWIGDGLMIARMSRTLKPCPSPQSLTRT
ncbi:hypothetical protein PENCOP_c015G03854 [Penicillium coprophilum]|uniref:Uncharacterized protein n=1 Tax=Penicillium coprophilum TaxID=36646 RepID=A0A1V6U8G7_9EURO|nr:hypothetical protein PENCOP_c015G03854 [Penicillium coprophilum]